MTEDVLLVEDVGDGVRVFRMNRPHRLNALDGELVGRLLAELERAAAESPAVRVLVLRGAGTSFCPGADLKWLSQGVLQDRVQHIGFQESLGRLCTSLAEAPQAVIASVHGYALAGGLEIAMACDIIVAAEDAQLGDQHINRGILPGGGGSQRLPRKLGLQRGLFYLLTGRRMTGTEAERMGLAALSVPAADLAEETLALANELAGKDGHALNFMKQMVRRGIELPLADAVGLELFLQTRYRAKSTAMDHAAADFASGKD
jgi:enoyl-CoA hydratase/carnithine racemase